MRLLARVNTAALAVVAGGFAALALSPVGEIWQTEPDVRDVYLWIAMFLVALSFAQRAAAARTILSLDRWTAAVWVLVAFAIVGFSPLWPVVLLGTLLGAVSRLVAMMAFQSFEERVSALLAGRRMS